MRESMWGIFIIVLGAVGIIAINLFQSLTVTNDQTYFLMKETTKAAMGDAVDLSYYKSTGKIRIVESKFVENLTRRFAQSAALNKNYNIVIHDVVEEPPKVSLSILTNANDLKQENYDIFQKIDSIYETIYKKTDLYDEKYFEDEKNIIGKPGTVPENSYYEDGKCPNASSGIDECISGDLQFLGWGPTTSLNDQACPEDLAKLGPENRNATYKSCVCGKWEDPIIEVVNSGRPRIVANKATYSWAFKKDGPVNDIDTTIKSEVVAGKCINSISFPECLPDGKPILVNEESRLNPVYNPSDAINRNLVWTTNNSNVSLVHENGSVIFPDVDFVTVIGKKLGDSLVTATSTNGKTGTCLVHVTTCDDLTIELGSTATVKLKNGTFVPKNTYTYSIGNTAVARINPANGLITTFSAGVTTYSINPNGNKGEDCRIIVTARPATKVFCPSSKVEFPLGTKGVASLVDESGKSLSGPGVADWSYGGSASDVDISLDGTISSGSAYSSLNYTANLKGDYVNGNNMSKVISCPFRVYDDKIEGCTVGNIWGRWDSKSLPTLCPQDISLNTAKYKSAVFRSVTPVFCGFAGCYDNNCSNGVVSSRPSIYVYSGANPTAIGTYPGSTVGVSTSGSSYTVTWNFYYNYDTWNNEAGCLNGKNKTNVVSTSKTGQLLPDDHKDCIGITTDKEESIEIVNPRSFSIDVYAGSTGSIPISVDAVFNGVDNYGGVEWNLSPEGRGTLSSKAGRSTIYTPPKTTTGTSEIPEKIIITAYHSNGVLSDGITINLRPQLDCAGLKISGPVISCPNKESSYIIKSNGALNYNDTATFYTGGSASIKAVQRELTSNYKVIGAGSTGTYSVNALILSGMCEAYPVNSLNEITMRTSSYSCTGEKYEFFTTGPIGEYCYINSPSKSPICNPGYIYNSINNKCEQYACSKTTQKLKSDGKCYDTVTAKFTGCPADFPEDKGVCAQLVATTQACPDGYTPSGSKCYKSGTYSTTYGSWAKDSCTENKYNCPSPCRTKTEAEDSGRTTYYKKSDEKCDGSSSTVGSYTKYTRTSSTSFNCPSSGDTEDTISYIGDVCTTTNRKTVEAANPCPNGGTKTYVGQLNGYRCVEDRIDLIPPTCYNPTEYSYDSSIKLCVKNSGGVNATKTGIVEDGCVPDVAGNKTYPVGDSCRSRMIGYATCK